jgi:hypothetical protein
MSNPNPNLKLKRVGKKKEIRKEKKSPWRQKIEGCRQMYQRK